MPLREALARLSPVAKAIAVLTDERTAWMTGNVICFDGGEDKVG